ncbi:MAG: hypothetical protein ABI640_20735 [Gammaproteobacteria bacterium]
MSDKRPPRAAHPGRTAGGGLLPVGEIVERLHLDRRSTNAPAPPRNRSGRVVTGRLKAHGGANYQFESHASPSYYLQILSSRGLETFWGVDLERAITQSQTQPKIGAMIGVQRIGSEPVTIPVREGDPKTAQPRTYRRGRWVVEDVRYFADSIQRARRDREARLADALAMRERPELRSAFISLHVAEKFAERNIRDPRDRALFVERVKAIMALSVSSGRTKSPPRREEPTR